MNRASAVMARPPLQLHRRIERLTMAGLLLTALLVGLVTLVPMYHHLRGEIDQRAEYDAHLLAQTSGHLLERFEELAALLASRSEIRNALARYNRGELALAELQAFSAPRLEDALTGFPEITGLVRLDARGQPVLGLRAPIPAELWPLPAPASRTAELSAPLLLDGQPLLLVGTPILSREGQRVGTDIAAFRLDKLSRQLSAIPLHPAAHSHLIHLGSGRVMHVHRDAPGLSEAPANCPLNQLLRDAPPALLATPQVLPLKDGQAMAFASPVPEHPGWAIALLADRAPLYAEARTELRWPLPAIVLLTLAGGLLTRLTIRPLSRRLKEQAQSLELAASVFDCSNEGIVLMDTRQQVIAINPAGCRLIGHDETSLAELTLGTLLAPEAPDLQCDSLWARAAYSGHWLGEMPMRRADGSTFHARLSLAAVFDDNRTPRHFAAVFTDISARKAEEERIRQMAYRDKLTGLPNRALAQDRLQQALRKTQRLDSRLAVLFLDLDHFKPVNDTFGHAVGDHLLQAVAQRLTDSLRSSDTVARLGGDEFLIILEDLADAQAAGPIADKLVGALQAPFQVDDHELHIGTSIGIALYPEDGEDAARLVRSADAAMYRAKEAGRNGYAFHAGRQPAIAGP
ncbi:MAG TPA: sensor domain-containing diguanylate cyclase [Pseudomonas sp.]|nr:sensor domain-containing diguanylate cyclase [Pseudomonas sp.]